MYEDAPGTTVSRLLQVPQYVVLTAAEVMFSVTGLGFAYSQVSNEQPVSCPVLNPCQSSPSLSTHNVILSF